MSLHVNWMQICVCVCLYVCGRTKEEVLVTTHITGRHRGHHRKTVCVGLCARTRGVLLVSIDKAFIMSVHVRVHAY